jgi:hypothetical protein
VVAIVFKGDVVVVAAVVVVVDFDADVVFDEALGGTTF